MKKALLYLLLFAYTTIICKPLLPALADGIAHVFWYSNHMATVHVENGHYHVHHENALEAQKGYPARDASLPKSVNPDAEHIAGSPACLPQLSAVITQIYFHIPPSAPALIYLNNDFPPPRA